MTLHVLQASEDDSYISDISDNISMDNFSNETESERPNLGAFLAAQFYFTTQSLVTHAWNACDL